MANLLSVNGTLKLMHFVPDENEERSAGYEAIDIGKPLVLRYLSFFLKHDDAKGGDEIMISTFVKTTEEKAGAAEAINYFNPEAKFKRKKLVLDDFGGQYYGHELCYYTKSYLGASIRLTTKVMELDKSNKDFIKALKSGVKSIAGLPAFASYLPYAAMASSGIDIVTKIIDFINKDDDVIRDHDIDLHFKRNYSRRLQSGRIVCVPGQREDKFIGHYKLNPYNRLVSIENENSEYRDSSYFVLQINSEKNRLYENFDYFHHSAELLAMTNRGGNPKEFIDTMFTSLKAYNDVTSIREIEDLSLDQSEDAKKHIMALYRMMSPDIKRLYQSRVEALIGPQNDSEV